MSQYLFVVFLSPLFTGIFSKFKSRIESKKGPSIFQPYYDIFKLFRKETLIPEGSGILFRYVPYAAFGVYSLISLIVPVLIPVPVFFTASADFLGGAILFSLAAFLKMSAAMNSGSNFSAMGTSRIISFNFLAEGALITVFFGVSLITATNNPYTTHSFLSTNLLQNFSLVHIFSTLAFFMLFLYETGKIPLQSEGLPELGMIDSGLNFEYSGKLLAINRWTSHMKQYLLGSIFLNVFFVPWGLFSTYPLFLLDFPVMFLKWMLLIFIVIVIETTLAKLRLFKVLDYLATAFTFSVLFLIFSEVIV
ncbi:MAG TPA: respiratory chain complex I subunit 1 family protein [Thermoplasmataceae archaeon]|nr:respiratory chain complex I subunit 1 family protein [Thermoplasmataceae archaeon]